MWKMGDDPSPPENVEMIVNDNEDDDSANREKLHFFSDGERRIDMILAYNDDHENNPDKKEMFDYYLNNLKEEFGLDTEVRSTLFYINNSIKTSVLTTT